MWPALRYRGPRWRLDADRAAGNNFRLIQFTPPGSRSSVQFGVNLTSAAPGSTQGLLLIVSDIEAARQLLVANSVDASEAFHCETGTACRFPGIGVRVSGSHLEGFRGRSWHFHETPVHETPVKLPPPSV